MIHICTLVTSNNYSNLSEKFLTDENYKKNYLIGVNIACGFLRYKVFKQLYIHYYTQRLQKWELLWYTHKF